MKKTTTKTPITDFDVIGLTGGICSGKTTVSNIFNDLGVEVIDTDIISHQLMTPKQSGYLQAVYHFGSEILLESGDINRSVLKEIIFSNSHQKEWLENMLHPMIYQQIDQHIDHLKSINDDSRKFLILVVPLLFETNFDKLCDKNLVINCEPEKQIERLIHRDGITRELAIKIIHSQLSNQKRLQLADYIIDNNRDTVLNTQVIDMNQLLIKNASKS